jgi:hypothetical protein
MPRQARQCGRRRLCRAVDLIEKRSHSSMRREHVPKRANQQRRRARRAVALTELRRAIEKAGVEFIAENGGDARVRMKKRKR